MEPSIDPASNLFQSLRQIWKSRRYLYLIAISASFIYVIQGAELVTHFSLMKVVYVILFSISVLLHACNILNYKGIFMQGVITCNITLLVRLSSAHVITIGHALAANTAKLQYTVDASLQSSHYWSECEFSIIYSSLPGE